MKIPCPTCGVHFPEDFDETMKPECRLWQTLGFPDDLSLQDKSRIWNWFFALDRDELSLRTGYSVDVHMRATKATVTGHANEFEEFVPGYKGWPDEKRRLFQKELARHMQTLDPVQRFMFLYVDFITKHPEWEEPQKSE